VTLEEYRHALGEATGHGWGFLVAYGLTWLVCALAWHRWSEKVAAYCTVFQGMVALPLALALTAVGAGGARPGMSGMDGLPVILSSGQLLALPIVIHLVATGRFTQVPLSMTILLVVHFAPYSWLYATPLYLVMGGVVSVAAVIATASAARSGPDSGAGASAAGRVCLVTGVVLLVCAAVARLL
jgi:hypothetical protein